VDKFATIFAASLQISGEPGVHNEMRRPLWLHLLFIGVHIERDLSENYPRKWLPLRAEAIEQEGRVGR